jgi:hypothetical protein
MHTRGGFSVGRKVLYSQVRYRPRSLWAARRDLAWWDSIAVFVLLLQVAVEGQLPVEGTSAAWACAA